MDLLGQLRFFRHEGYINFKKPNPRKNIFHNYADHLNYLLECQLLEKLGQILAAENLMEMLNTFNDNELLKHVRVFDKLRDCYDYMDELAGLLVVPLLATGASLLTLAMSIYEGCHALAIKTDIAQNDYENHLDMAGKYLFIATSCFVLSVANAFKSLISLITRPLITLVSEQKTQHDEYRFRDESRPATDKVINFVEDAVDDLFNLGKNK